jgi:iron complex transport system substrate-binding protein
MRIVSLLPSATEIVCALGQADQLVGVTHSCDLPAGLPPVPVLTRTHVPCDASSREIDDYVRASARHGVPLYEVDEAALAALRPDLVITQGLCAVCAVPEAHARHAALAIPGGAEVLSLTPANLAEVWEGIRDVGHALGASGEAATLVAALEARVDAVSARSMRARMRPRVALLEWLDPPFACGHWNPELVRLAGGEEVLGVEGAPSRRASWAELAAARPDVVFVACCGYPLERSLADLTPAAVAAVGATLGFASEGRRHFSRPGPYLAASLEMLAFALDPARHPLPAGAPVPRRIAWAGRGARLAGGSA